MTQLIGILGYPLSHSISPAFQQAALDYHGLDIRYEAWETPPEDLEKAVRRLVGDGFLGANVTVPHKEAVCPYLHQIDEQASGIGAVNTIVNRGGVIAGYNTDAHGFLKALTLDGSFQPRGKAVLLLGAGGVARAAAFVLAKEGIASIVITDVILERAQNLARGLQSGVAKVNAMFPHRDDLAQAASRADLIVNCTPLGMKHSKAEKETPITFDMIPSGALVYDLVYNPPDTPLIKEAQKAGARTLGGLRMLIYQGAESFRLWTGKKAPLEVMFAAAKGAMGMEE